MNASYTDFGPNEPDDTKWTKVTIGKPNEKLVLLEIKFVENEGYVVTAMSNRRNIYKSKDQGVIWTFDRQAGRLEYWTMRVCDKWSELRIVSKAITNKILLWYWRRFNK